MATLTTDTQASWLPPLPREHGAWFILAGSALVGPVLTGRFGAGHLALLLGAYAALIGRSALRGPRTLDRVWAAFLLGFAVVINVAIFVSAPSPMLLGAGAAAALLGGAQIALDRRRLQRHLAAEIVGIGLLTALAPASLALCGLDAGPRALSVVAANALYFLVAVPYVRVRVFAPKVPEVWRLMRFDPLVLGVLGAIVMALALGPLAAAAFAVQIARAARLAWSPPSPPRSVTRLGYVEVGSTVFYVVVLWLVSR
jgi:hypothetical protein